MTKKKKMGKMKKKFPFCSNKVTQPLDRKQHFFNLFYKADIPTLKIVKHEGGLQNMKEGYKTGCVGGW